MTIDRSIAYARSRDGKTTVRSSWRVLMQGNAAVFDDCDIDPGYFAPQACEAWRELQATLPAERGRHLVCEVGLVRDGSNVRTFCIAHCHGAIVETARALIDTAPAQIAWAEVPPDMTLVLGPSATLTLCTFIIDGVPGSMTAGDWPIGPQLTVLNTPRSPYPPQDRPGRPSVRIGPESVTAENRDSGVFLLLQRGDHWQRPVDALYNLARRNLAISWTGAALSTALPTVTIDTLSAETEPTLASSQWLATWHIDTPAGRLWGTERLAIAIASASVLRSVVAAGPPTIACVCDPIEGDVYGMAPAVQIQPQAYQIEGTLR